ncbi:MAG: response regulator transcription factor [Robiginitomaculum sp.]|nr:response regulator transcription factor [Robiginitomaculum sp.]
MHILLIEDDKQAAEFTLKSLQQFGHSVHHIEDGKDGLLAILSHEYDVILADRRLSGMDGMTIVKRTRAASVLTPFMFLTSLDHVDDIVEGLDAGADDYLVKPFAFSELRARIDALYRRPAQTKSMQDKIILKDLTIGLLKRCVFRDGVQINLQPREFRLLEYLARNAGRVATKTTLLEHVWEFNFDPKTNVIETHISRLRSKIDDGQSASIIKTVRGAGYMIDLD